MQNKKDSKSVVIPPRCSPSCHNCLPYRKCEKEMRLGRISFCLLRPEGTFFFAGSAGSFQCGDTGASALEFIRPPAREKSRSPCGAECKSARLSAGSEGHTHARGTNCAAVRESLCYRTEMIPYPEREKKADSPCKGIKRASPAGGKPPVADGKADGRPWRQKERRLQAASSLGNCFCNARKLTCQRQPSWQRSRGQRRGASCSRSKPSR